MKKTHDSIKDFWDSRSHLKKTAGSNDYVLKDIEIGAILEQVEPYSDILDVGCGNGETLITLIKEKNCKGAGVDFSPGNISLAKNSAIDLDFVDFSVATIPGGLENFDSFQYVITQRCLINLPDKKYQKEAFLEIMSHVKLGGYYIMVENSIQGLDRLNQLRKMLELDILDPPWHNEYLDEEDVIKWETTDFKLVKNAEAIASTYYLLSRVIYAGLEKDKGNLNSLEYNSEINQLAYRLPRNLGNGIGATKMWIWKREVA